MSRRANPTVVGFFVVAGVLLTVVAVIMLGGGRLFHDRVGFMSWFEGSVTGLQVGAPVKFKGVPIGQVTAIRLENPPGVSAEDWRRDVRIPVFYDLDRNLISRQGAAVDVGDPNEVAELIASGMRAELTVESILTGRKYIALDIYPDSPALLVGDTEYDDFEVPTITTGLEWLERDVQGLMAKLTALDVEGLVEAIKDAANQIGGLTSGPELQEALAELPEALDQSRRTLAAIETLAVSSDSTMRALRPNIDASTEDLESAARELEATLASVRAVLEPGSPLLSDLERSLSGIAAAAQAIAELADYLQQNPSALLRGKDVEDN
jgi:paraquat-inducible protein B